MNLLILTGTSMGGYKMKIINLILFMISVFAVYPLSGQYFISDASLDEDFCPDSVLVIMDQIVVGLNKNHEISYF